ncbi:hypothetical protein DVH05_014420 [Phytophthora capsici]|nr:hypothetical protein DVH05_014420 [Phytophthora capsici]
MPATENIAHRNQLATQRRQRDAEWHRRRRDRVTIDGQTDETDPLPHLLQDGDSGSHIEEMGNLDGIDDAMAVYDALETTRINDAERVDIESLDVDWDWFHTEFGGLNDDGALQEPIQEHDEATRAQAIEEHNEAIQVQETVGAAAANVQPRDDVTDCLVCCDTLLDKGKLWICKACRQPYHRDCAKQCIEHDDRCANCRTPMVIEVEDDEVLIVGHKPAPASCLLCKKTTGDIIKEGPQCSHKYGIRCPRWYNAVILKEKHHERLRCPSCAQPFPADSMYLGEGSTDGNVAEENTAANPNTGLADYNSSDFGSESDSD